jgi:4-aminobutyrate aminotransferase-like enzyme/GNAT superfamily N-acetyltransferase
MNRLIQLEYQHRLEEVCERFGFTLEAHDGFGRLRFEQFARVRVSGRYLTPHRMRTLAFVSGLQCDEEGLYLGWGQGQRSPEAIENGLLMLFDVLLQQDPEAFLLMPRRAIEIPESGELPESAAFLERFYGENFLPREKKPAVVDLRHSQGPYLRSIDAEPLQIIDAASQIASLAAGFRPDAVQAALDDGAFDPYLVASPPQTSSLGKPAFTALRSALLEVAPVGIEHVAWTNSGAEANEKAFHIARINGPGGRRILAFEGAFHGRTLLSLFSTWNATKRGPYELPGFETTFVPMPALEDPYGDPFAPAGWRQAWADPDGARADLRGDDDLLNAEIDALMQLEKEIRAGDVLAVIIEPYQCEGGDRSASRRFFQGLRSLTRGQGVPLIFDEVQSGFGLEGRPFWHQRLKMLDVDGQPDGPDLLTGAKRAQLGYVLSRWPDPARVHGHAASAVRGRVHLETILALPGFEARARAGLEALTEKWSHIISRPRAFGDAFAFDLPNGGVAKHLIGQRFYRGYMVYIAGERTLRYRLNRGMLPVDVDRIFEVIDASLAALVAQAGGEGPELDARMAVCTPPVWHEAPAAPAQPRIILADVLMDDSPETADRALRVYGELNAEDREEGAKALGLALDERGEAARAALWEANPEAFEGRVGVPLVRWAADALGTRIRRLTPAIFDAEADALRALHAAHGAPGASLTSLRTLVDAANAVCLLAEDPNGLVGMAFAAPLELWPCTDGPRQDRQRGRKNTLYSADLTVAPAAHGRGVGFRLRSAQIAAALKVRGDRGRPRYAFVSGRNAVGAADAIWRINQSFGAYLVQLHAGQHGAREGLSRYFRLPLRRQDRRAFVSPAATPTRIDLGNGVSMPTGTAHPLLVRARGMGVFDEAALTKLTVSNFITRPYARWAEYLRHIAPRANGHLYFTSSADEMVDKSLRALKHQRTEGRIAIGLQGGFQGGVTAAARSLSAPGGNTPRNGFFDWPLVPHPGRDPRGCIRALNEIVKANGPDTILGLYVESVQAHTGEQLSGQAWQMLCAWRDRTGVPLVLNETTTGMYRSGRGPFWWVDSVSGDADIVLWWSGGQIGHVFSNDKTFVNKPLTLISTWDGDQLSATRLLYQSFACGYVPIAERAAQLDAALHSAGFGGSNAKGLGLYRVLKLDAFHAARVQASLAGQGIDVSRPQSDVLLIATPITVTEGQIEALARALKTASAET